MKQAKIYLRNGSTLTFKCKELTVYKNKLGEYTSITLSEPDRDVSFLITEVIATELVELEDYTLHYDNWMRSGIW